MFAHAGNVAHREYARMGNRLQAVVNQDEAPRIGGKA